ncbi:MAG: FHA domain-containing protein [Desmonostoc vinosum HA7617-LM4]|jgi:methylglyoxal synthase|nr:FHA domain-containing protein [Desmonostoc vinosum HA7617-LM4]
MKVKVSYSPNISEVNEIELNPETAKGGEWLIGRSPDSDVVLDSPDVSRLHAKFLIKAGSHYFSDLGSRNGSIVNGKQAEKDRPYVLKDGDVIRIADYVLIVEAVTPLSEQLPETVFRIIDPSLFSRPRPTESVSSSTNAESVPEEASQTTDEVETPEIVNEVSEVASGESDEDSETAEAITTPESTTETSEEESAVLDSLSEELTDFDRAVAAEATYVQPRDIFAPEQESQVPADISAEDEEETEEFVGEQTVVQLQDTDEFVGEQTVVQLQDTDDQIPEVTSDETEEVESPEAIATEEEVESPEAIATEEEVESPEAIATEEELEEVESPEAIATEEELESPEAIATEEEVESPEAIATEEEVESPEAIATEEEVESPEAIVTEEEVESPEVIVTEEEVESPEAIATEEEVESPEVIATEEEVESPEAIATEEELEEVESPEVIATEEELEEVESPEAIATEEDTDISAFEEDTEDTEDNNIQAQEEISEVTEDTTEPEETNINEPAQMMTDTQVVLIAHETKKTELAEFIAQHQELFSKITTITWPSISEVLKHQAGITVTQEIPAATSGGYQTIASLVGSGEVFAVIFLRDFLQPQPGQANEEALLRLCNINQVILATNVPTAEAIVHYIKYIAK